MSFKEVKPTKTPAIEVYDEDGDLTVEFATEAFCSMSREDLLKLDPRVLVDVILDSREVMTKTAEVEYVSTTLLAAAMNALVHGEPTLTEMFKNLTNNGTHNMTQGELSNLIQGFTFAENKKLAVFMALDKLFGNDDE